MEDLPTPPLPDATANTRVVESGWAKGMTGSAALPRREVRSSRRCSSLMTSVVTVTVSTPSTSSTAARVFSVMVDFIGQPAMVR